VGFAVSGLPAAAAGGASWLKVAAGTGVTDAVRQVLMRITARVIARSEAGKQP
jgi:hypothetical protein